MNRLQHLSKVFLALKKAFETADIDDLNDE